MAGSLLRAFVGGTRQVLTVQLFVSIAAVALAGWTLGVTNELIRERDRLRERVIQLEEDMGARGIVVPSTPTVVDTAPPPAEDAYPGPVGLGDQTPQTPAADGQSDTTTTSPEGRTFNPGQIVTDLFAPAPPMRTVVLHARNERDAALARRVGERLAQAANVRVIVNTIAPRSQQQSGYAYFDGRQSRAAADLVTQFNTIARENEIAPWSAQLRGTALPEQGEYTADRLDIVLPPLPQPSLQLDPRALELRRVEPQQQPPIR
jgi:hypothetical protein